MISYVDSTAGLTADKLGGFLVDWPVRPSPETLLRVLAGSDEVWLAVDDDSGRVVSYVTAITDGVISAYIPLLEVLAEHRSRGIGSELVKRMLGKLRDYYMIDLTCGPELELFYSRLGFQKAAGMAVRDRRQLSRLS